MESGIWLDIRDGNSENIIIKENNIMNNGDGICINDYHDNYNSFTIIDNKISLNEGHGLNIYGSYKNKITGNIISDNNNGLLLSYSYDNIFRNNTFKNNLNNLYVEGGEIYHYHQDIDTTNTIDGKKIYYLVEQTDLVIDESFNIGYINLISCKNITLKNLIISNEIIGLLIINTTYSNVEELKIYNNTQCGIRLYHSSNNSIKKCNIYNNSDSKGIKLFYSSNNSLTKCHVYNNDIGIDIEYSNYNNLTKNNIAQNNNGILFSGCYYYGSEDKNRIFSNNISNNYNGINLRRSNGNIILGNNIINNFYGINSYGYYYSRNLNNIIDFNNISSNEYGIFLQYYSNENKVTNNTCNLNNVSGIYLDSCYDTLISNNNCSLNSGHGISLKYSDDCVIDGNILNDNKAVFEPSTEGLIGYWKMDEEYWNGTVGEVADSSGYGNNGTSMNGANTTEFGMFGRCGNFDGQDDYVDCGNYADLNIINAITIEAWINFHYGGSMNPRIISKGADFDGYELLTLSTGDKRKVCFSIGTTFLDSKTYINNNTWYHLACTYDGYTMRIYINGVEDSFCSKNGPIPTNNFNLNIGRKSKSAYDLYKGLIDEVKIYNRALSHEEIIQLISANGIHLFESENNLISNNTCRNNRNGIHLESYSRKNIIKNNTCINNLNGIKLDSSSSDCRIIKNYCLYSNVNGIHIGQSSSNTVINDNIILSNVNGIDIYQSRRNEIKENTIVSNNNGLYLHFSNSNTIKANNISKNCDGLILKWSSNNNIIDNSILQNDESGIVTSDSFLNIINGNEISWNNNHGLYFYESYVNDLIDNEIKNNRIAIEQEYCEKNTILDNIVINNEESIRLTNVKDIVVKNNIFYDSYYEGIRGWICVNCTFSNNYLENSGYEGIQLWDSKNCNILENLIRGHSSGIYIHHSINMNINGCEVENNYRYGISLDNSDSCIIINNNISDNNYGIYIEYDSNSNSILHNNFINNEENSSYDEGINIWDDGEYGNYWDDYKVKYPKSRRIPLKGIWDTPYNIEGGDNKDNCPLLKRWPKPSSAPTPKTHSTVNSYIFRIFNIFPHLNRFLEHFPILNRLLNFLK